MAVSTSAHVCLATLLINKVTSMVPAIVKTDVITMLPVSEESGFCPTNILTLATNC